LEGVNTGTLTLVEPPAAAESPAAAPAVLSEPLAVIEPVPDPGSGLASPALAEATPAALAGLGLGLAVPAVAEAAPAALAGLGLGSAEEGFMAALAEAETFNSALPPSGCSLPGLTVPARTEAAPAAVAEEGLAGSAGSAAVIGFMVADAPALPPELSALADALVLCFFFFFFLVSALACDLEDDRE
jgi:hypothetical protein